MERHTKDKVLQDCGIGMGLIFLGEALCGLGATRGGFGWGCFLGEAQKSLKCYKRWDWMEIDFFLERHKLSLVLQGSSRRGATIRCYEGFFWRGTSTKASYKEGSVSV